MSEGPIEKGANDGQVTYAADLIKALKAGVSSRARTDTISSKPKVKTRRKKGDVDGVPKAQNSTAGQTTTGTQPKDENWGLFEPLHGIFGPVADIVKPLLTSNLIIGLLLSLLLISWFRNSRAPTPTNGLGHAGLPTPERVAAYEEMWRREESGLWDWLEERVGMDRLAYPVGAGSGSGDDSATAKARKQRERERALAGKSMESKLLREKMSEREVDDAIRVTQERLEALKGVVEKRKARRAGGGGEDGIWKEGAS